MRLDEERLRGAGFRVDRVAGGAMIATDKMTQAQFVPMDGDELQLVLQRSSFHRQINAALGGVNPKLPSEK